MSTELKFSCTQCGRCCHESALPLTFDEAIAWLEDEGTVGIYLEADPWSVDPPAENLRAAHRKRRSFAAACGSSMVRITAILVAPNSGVCRNLDSDMRCRIYEKRPMVCRIYPSEVSPFIQLNPAHKGCPPEAWVDGEVILSNGQAPAKLQALIERSRGADQNEAPLKRRLCCELNMNVAALADEGYIAYLPAPDILLEAMRRVQNRDQEPTPVSWRLYSPGAATIESLSHRGFAMVLDQEVNAPYSFLRAAAVPA